MSIINVVKLLYPQAEIRAYVCKDQPVFATPLFEIIIKPYLAQKATGTKFG